MKTTERFSSRVENYVKYRPGYPQEVVTQLEALNVLQKNAVIADIGSGTGISAKLFLENNYTVTGVEPNKEMREAGEIFLSAFGKFSSIDGTAEATTLADQSADAILAGQAFHWFNAEKAKTEFRRILKANGHVVLAWNDRRPDSTSFLKGYEALLKKFGTDYSEVNHRNIDEKVFDEFWGRSNWRMFSVPNHQDFDYEGLKGRLLSSSYVPGETDERYPGMLRALEELFEREKQNGVVRFEYDTKVYYGKLN